MKTSLFVLIVCLQALQGLIRKVEPFDELSVEMDMQEMVAYHGYPLLRYRVHTEDGYILTLFRIVGSRNQSLSETLKDGQLERKKAVLMLHGMTNNA